jgi:hypothetical protein
MLHLIFFEYISITKANKKEREDKKKSEEDKKILKNEKISGIEK